MSELAPDYWDCPRNCRHGADCEAAQLEQSFRQEAQQEINERLPSFLKRQSLNSLIADLNVALTLDSEVSRNRTGREWTMREAAYVQIVRGEFNRARNVDSYNRKLEGET